jgi:hypothetical protein
MITVYIVRYKVGQGYGGPEEGGWWYGTGELDKNFEPLEVALTTDDDEKAYEVCRSYNYSTQKRYNALSYRERQYTDKYEYTIEDTPYPVPYYPEHRPHYE